ncbi:SDR family oxidoreductase [Amycolatopsis acidicola]|uniref:SDR family oxidoreductase n=1 Tax=Amycolatopsis acidicola TaxID=2596893 RepID=A0A5N0UKR7_9PSEU|nr:SDR family NAD(P)-dependent oxidoreductase [Amycolatopsis acidicola]KAA9149858.1 SDR family oxidoreductase [Amycolatopsis acidicola]
MVHPERERTESGMQLLAGKSVLVTGAARGLGAAIAEACVRHGANVLVTDILAEELRRTAEALGSQAYPQVLDVTSEASWAAAARVARERFGGLDVLVNNAGLIVGKPLAGQTAADLERSFRVNVTGTFLGLQAFVALHKETGAKAGSVINIASVRGLIGGAGATTYSATKFGVRGLAKSAAVELGPLGIRVNALCPGPIESEMSVGNPQFAGADWGAYAAKLPLGRLGRPSDIGEAAAWLGSDASAFVTGIDLPVDGGLTATSYSIELAS